MSAATHAPPRAGAPRTLRSGAGEPLFAPAVARGLAFTALAAWGALHWMAMLDPAQPGRAWKVVLVGVVAMLAMLAAGRAPGRWRTLAALVATVPLLALALVAGGVPHEFLKPTDWGELSAGISRGLADLPGIRVPYRGIDQWVLVVIPLGGSLLVLAAALLAFWPRAGSPGRPGAALVLLILLYVVPVVALVFSSEFLRGAVFSLLMVAFLRLEKLRIPDAAGAGALVLAAVVLALVVAPALNRSQPWWDYEAWAQDTSASKLDSFSWDHTYGPLHWPRDGRELLRIRAQKIAYWKAENLDQFDGRRWVRSTYVPQTTELPDNPKAIAEFKQTIKVTVRNLRTPEFITAGYTYDVHMPNVDAVATLDGSFTASRTLTRGDTYTATVYAPRPTIEQRQRAGTKYPSNLLSYRTLNLPSSLYPGANTIAISFPAFGSHGELSAAPPGTGNALGVIQHSGYQRSYRLSRQLLAEAKTPEDYVENVLAYLSGPGFTYSERPPKAAQNLDGFLFDAKTGYCQQYSGAMALLLRMAGIPTRVSTGFSSGTSDIKTGEYVVRDLDAHSWVEAFFPHWGWVTFDPTPASAPERGTPADVAADKGAGGQHRSTAPALSGDLPSLRTSGKLSGRGLLTWWEWALVGLGALGLAALVAAGVRRKRLGRPTALSELERALRRARREPEPGTTLHALEKRFAATPAAAGYVRALREARYRGRPGQPTREQRRGLRSELRRGSGVLGLLRAWWAVPPR